MGWFSKIRDSVVNVATAPFVAPVKFVSQVASGGNVLDAAASSLTHQIAAPTALAGTAANIATGGQAAKLPIVGGTLQSAQDYYKTGNYKDFWKNQLSLGLAAGGAGAITNYLGGELGVDFSGLQSEFGKYQNNLTDLKNLLPKSAIVAGQSSPSVATFPAAQASIDQKNNMQAIMLVGGLALVGYMVLKK